MTAPDQTAQPKTSTKAAIALAAWYTAQHSLDQQKLAASTVVALAPLWKILDFNHLDITQLAWVQAVAPVLERAYQESQRTAAEYVQSVKWAHIPTAAPLPQISEPSAGIAKHFTPDPFPAASAQVSMLVTGPAEVKRQMPAPGGLAMDRGLVASSGAAVRIVGDGGRGVVQKLVELDHQAKGYARVLDRKPCYFCAMLASRGAVYKEHSFDTSNARFHGEGITKVHDHCVCSLRPIYSSNDSFDDTARVLQKHWDKATRGYSSQDAVNAFRRSYDGSGGSFTAPAVESESDIAMRHLPALEQTLQKLLNSGFADDSPQVQWNRQQIDRFSAALH